MVRLTNAEIPTKIDEKIGKHDQTYQLFKFSGLPVWIACHKIDAHFQYGERHIVLHTDDCPFEELVDITLIDNGAIIDSVSTRWGFSWPENIQITGKNEFSFEFIGRDYRCVLFDRPKFIFKPALFLREFAWHKRHFKSYFKLTSTLSSNC